MNSAPFDYRWISYLGLAINAVLMIVGLMIAVAGWRRQKNFGYVLIAAWACAGISWRLVQVPWVNMVQRFFSTTATSADMNRYMLLSGIASSVVIHGLLLAGLAFLVFQPRLSRSPRKGQKQ